MDITDEIMIRPLYVLYIISGLAKDDKLFRLAGMLSACSATDTGTAVCRADCFICRRRRPALSLSVLSIWHSSGQVYSEKNINPKKLADETINYPEIAPV